jgi:apolipoprotein N-acyltransferase
MSETVTFKGRKTGSLAFALLCLVVAALMVWMGMRDHSFANWAVGIFMGLSAAYYALPVLTDSVYLRLDEAGLEIGSALRAKERIKWTEICALRLATGHRGLQVLEIMYASTESPTGDSRRKRKLTAEYSAPLTEILATLDMWRERHAARTAPPP